MLDGKRIAVVVPAHDEEELVGTTVAGIPAFVDRIFANPAGSGTRTLTSTTVMRIATCLITQGN